MTTKKRSTIDFSKHELEIIKNENVLIHILQQPNSSICKVVFINTMGICSVTGDFGNWIFCREFHPSKDGYVSGGYWDEKLNMHSVQSSSEFDTEQTEKDIDYYVENYVNEDTSEEELAWIERLRQNSDDYYSYITEAYRNQPYDVDSEAIPLGKVRNPRLNIIYDAFDEICSRIKD